MGVAAAKSVLAKDEKLSQWVTVSYGDSTQALCGLLGEQMGTQLDVVFHSELRQHLRVGDTMPVVCVRPDKAVAKAMFFHNDGTITVVTVVAKGSEWIVMKAVDASDQVGAASHLLMGADR
jgi:hypothetical protein